LQRTEVAEVNKLKTIKVEINGKKQSRLLLSKGSGSATNTTPAIAYIS
jgi:hypothetical protein